MGAATGQVAPGVEVVGRPGRRQSLRRDVTGNVTTRVALAAPDGPGRARLAGKYAEHRREASLPFGVQSEYVLRPRNRKQAQATRKSGRLFEDVPRFGSSTRVLDMEATLRPEMTTRQFGTRWTAGVSCPAGSPPLGGRASSSSAALNARLSSEQAVPAVAVLPGTRRRRAIGSSAGPTANPTAGPSSQVSSGAGKLSVPGPMVRFVGRHYGVSGRYQASCGEGFCALHDNPGRSKIEAEIFTLLTYALGGGRANADLRRWLSPPLKVDMLFEDSAQKPILVVEYDGAYFHRDRSETDQDKAMWVHHILDVPVIRIREAPLQDVTRWDLVVPARSTGDICSRSLLLHLLHLEHEGEAKLSAKQVDDAVRFLEIGQPLDETLLLCRAAAATRASGAVPQGHARRQRPATGQSQGRGSRNGTIPVPASRSGHAASLVRCCYQSVLKTPLGGRVRHAWPTSCRSTETRCTAATLARGDPRRRFFAHVLLWNKIR